MAATLTVDEVRHVARLARLRLDESQVERYRTQLATVLDYVAKLQELDVEAVEPLAHPLPLANRLAADDVEPSMPLESVLRNAPATEGPFLAVPKVLGDGDAADAGSSGGA
jgi:aspartyl-tRNA(Asn)/glutamyl-tRNA(Gln) amidotransferase subunit C